MRWTLGIAIATALVGIGAAEDGESAWISDWSKARAAAREQGKPIFVVFR